MDKSTYVHSSGRGREISSCALACARRLVRRTTSLEPLSISCILADHVGDLSDRLSLGHTSRSDHQYLAIYQLNESMEKNVYMLYSLKCF